MRLKCHQNILNLGHVSLPEYTLSSTKGVLEAISREALNEFLTHLCGNQMLHLALNTVIFSTLP